MLAATFLLAPAALQACAMLADEGIYHRRRGLPRWERLGHPLDTLTVASCYGVLAVLPPGRGPLAAYCGLAVLSCLFITKDEFVHSRLCGGAECWLHAVLFVLHPVVFTCLGLLWWTGIGAPFIAVQLLLTLAFCVYQIMYWSVPWKRHTGLPSS